MGPILIFDKSALQGLSVDESVWLDTHYLANITPLFFVETLADLEKEVKGGRTPEQVVGNLAEKTPSGGRPNVHHVTMCAGELCGHPIGMDHRPVIGGGRPTKVAGKRGLVFEQPPEFGALQRWQSGHFLELEREFAHQWRETLSGLDLDATAKLGQQIIKRHGRPKDLAETKKMAATLLDKSGSRYAIDAFKIMFPERARVKIEKSWRSYGMPPLREFAPYTAHVLTVDLFFCIALGADLISRERPSNKIDIAYLYYLPFCMAFTSNDNLHTKTVPLFLDEDQAFVSGRDLKVDLAKLDAHYSTFSDEIKARGVMSFAHYPPTEGDFLVSKLWDQFMSSTWRDGASADPVPASDEANRKIVEEVERIVSSVDPGGDKDFSVDEADHVVIKHVVRIFKGKWRMLPSEVEREEE